jgi:hypothetical protein
LQDAQRASIRRTLSLDLLLLKRFSPLPFPLLDDPQPRKASGEDHHYDQNGVLYHWIALS